MSKQAIWKCLLKLLLLSDMLWVCVCVFSTVKSCCSSGDTNPVGLHKHLLFFVEALYSFYVQLINLIKQLDEIVKTLLSLTSSLTPTTRITSFYLQKKCCY